MDSNRSRFWLLEYEFLRHTLYRPWGRVNSGDFQLGKLISQPYCRFQ
uniref:WGR domain protein n=1 Tax=Myoviridae sp. ct9dX1 TaxID=2827665 RepID=A0A8S5TIN5_9CAUD|nr:MAG TPA: WGR domain protein [Myoviridae sp. ct9dX1]